MNTTRRDALRKIGLAGSLIAIPGIAGALVNRAEAGVCALPPGDDAELIRLGEEFDRLYAEWLPINAERKRLAAIQSTAWEAAGTPFSIKAWVDSCDACGLTPAEDANDAAMDRLDALAATIDATPAHSLAGIATKLRVIRYVAFSGRVLDRADDDLDWDVLCFVRVQREVEALAETEARGL